MNNTVDFSRIIDCEEYDAINYIEEKTENTYRIVYRDGRYFVVTQDVVLTRINLKIENGIVIGAYKG